MTESAPKFNVSDVKCNGAGSYASLISEDNYNAIQTYVSVYRKVEDFRDLIVEMAQKTKEDGYQREIQQLVKVDNDTKNLVDSKWSSYEL